MSSIKSRDDIEAKKKLVCQAAALAWGTTNAAGLSRFQDLPHTNEEYVKRAIVKNMGYYGFKPKKKPTDAEIEAMAKSAYEVAVLMNQSCQIVRGHKFAVDIIQERKFRFIPDLKGMWSAETAHMLREIAEERREQYGLQNDDFIKNPYYQDNFSENFPGTEHSVLFFFLKEAKSSQHARRVGFYYSVSDIFSTSLERRTMFSRKPDAKLLLQGDAEAIPIKNDSSIRNRFGKKRVFLLYG